VKSEKLIRALLLLALYAAVVVAVVGIAFVDVRNMQEQTRGVTFGVAPGEPAPLGVNVSLEQDSNDDELRALALIRDGGFRIIRQHLPWSDIEPRPGEFQWTKWDRIVAHAREYGLDLVAVLDTTPTWARDPGEADLVNAAPARVEDYARFVQAIVRRYGDSAAPPSWHLYVQLWDNPNVHPFWGRRNADPSEYTALLRAGAQAARSASPGIKVLSAGLAPNGELVRGHPDYSDVLFLRGMYEAGARDYFDILGAKPYGMWTGPEDRRVSENVLNFSRVILLREEMVDYGDAAKPIWAVEFGWNALPPGWQGKASPWGTDAEEVQAARLVQAVQRARSEWSWMGALLVQTFQPNAPSNDPLWGFALVGQDMRPRGLYGATATAVTAPFQPATFDLSRFYAILALLAVIGAVAAWRGSLQASRIPWAEGWSILASRFARLPEAVQFILLVAAVLVFYYSRNTAVNFLVLGVIVFLFALRLDLGLAITVFTIPFYLFPKNLVGSMQFSLVEVLTLGAAAAWGLQQIVERRPPADAGGPTTNDQQLLSTDQQDLAVRGPRSAVLLLRSAVRRLTPLDWSVICFVLIGILSVRIASNFGVASREFRVIVIEPALLYGLIRASKLSPRALQRLVDAFILSALVVSLIGLYQFLFTDYVIVVEGVRRVLAVYGSPNNLALFLERALPLVLVLALYVEKRRRRVAYALAAVPIALCIYLTYSRAAWLVGLPPALLLVGLLSGRRARLAIVGLMVVGALALIPFMRTDRFWSLFETGTGTGFFRVSVWESGLAMLRDHPVFGVGLDNFLYEYAKYANPDAWREPNLSHPHNIVLDFWLRMGMLGLGVMIWMVVQFYTKGIRALQFEEDKALALGLMAGMTAALAHGMIDAAYFYVDIAFVWMMMLGIMGRLGIRDWGLGIEDWRLGALWPHRWRN
jgi:O-antigen ligase